jgi:hypothetical protein
MYPSHEVEQHLQSQYHDKILVLRGFYSGDHLQFESSGALIGISSPSDWTADGFVRIKEIRFAHRHMLIEGKRLLVIEPDEREFAFADEKDNEQRNLKIEAELDADHLSAGKADAAMSKIFLTTQDSLANLVPAYWVPCVSDAVVGKDGSFRFASEFLTIPGVVASGTGGESSSSAMRKPPFDCRTPQRQKKEFIPG